MKEKQIKNKTEMNYAQEELCKRLELVGFDVDRDTCRAVRKLFPQSISARYISLELDELFGKLSDSADIDAVWEALCADYTEKCVEQGATIITSADVTPLYYFMSNGILGEVAINTLEYLIAYNHNKLDELLHIKNGNMNSAWLALFNYLEETSRRAETLPLIQRSAYINSVRIGGEITEDKAHREEFTFPYATRLKYTPRENQEAVFIIRDELARRNQMTPGDISAQISKNDEPF